MPELRARSRTPSTSRSASVTSPSPKKAAAGSSSWSSCCFTNCCSNMTPQRRTQVCTAGWSLFGILIIAGGICTVYHRVDAKLPLGTLSERLAFTFRCLLLSGITLASAIKYVAYKRFTTGAFSPLSGNERAVEIPQRILQNTLEQFVLHSCTILALASYLNAEQMKFIPLFCLYFFVGRVFFFLGYPAKRHFGFVLSWVPTGLSIWVTIYFMFTRGLTAF